MDTINFEVGKFYRVQITPCYSSIGRKISSLCVKVSKCKVTFRYIARIDGKLKFFTVGRRKSMTSGGVEYCYSPEIWSGISHTEATEVCEKPEIWDSVEG